MVCGPGHLKQLRTSKLICSTPENIVYKLTEPMHIHRHTMLHCRILACFCSPRLYHKFSCCLFRCYNLTLLLLLLFFPNPFQLYPPKSSSFRSDCELFGSYVSLDCPSPPAPPCPTDIKRDPQVSFFFHSRRVVRKTFRCAPKHNFCHTFNFLDDVMLRANKLLDDIMCDASFHCNFFCGGFCFVLFRFRRRVLSFGLDSVALRLGSVGI